ncbi:hypothetical protein FO519_006731 [Halicephalobus sp. NKZ332]|nr:hypothetical protein FO519_006731 [Halicephalobus sp. NKZ332]
MKFCVLEIAISTMMKEDIEGRKETVILLGTGMMIKEAPEEGVEIGMTKEGTEEEMTIGELGEMTEEGVPVPEDRGTMTGDPETVMMTEGEEIETKVGDPETLMTKEEEIGTGTEDNRENPTLIPWGGIPPVQENPAEPVEKELPSLKPSGKLLEDTNMVNGVVVKYVEPPEAKLPKAHWQLHPFRNVEGQDPEPLPVMHIHRRSCFLIGRDRKVCQFPMDHPSCSKQHAALQFRSLTYTRPDGEKGRRTRPYLIDLGSSNGSFINDERIEGSRYYELKHGDEIKFGFSSRSFIILNATAAKDEFGNVKKEESEDDEEEEKLSVKVKEEEVEDDKFEL